MDKILKESYIYKIIMFFKNLFSKLFRESFIIQGFLKNNYNEKNISQVLDFYIDPKEIVFTGRLKEFPEVTISFYMKPVE